MKRNWQLLGWATVLMIGAALVMFHGIQERQEFQRIQLRGKTAIGEVTHAEKGWGSRDDGEPPYIEFKFTVDGTEYTGASQRYIPEGKSVQIKYLPSNPNKNLVRGDKGRFSDAIFLALIPAGAGILLGMGGYSEATAKLVIRENTAVFEARPFIHFPIIVLCMTSAYFVLHWLL